MDCSIYRVYRNSGMTSRINSSSLGAGFFISSMKKASNFFAICDEDCIVPFPFTPEFLPR